MTDVIFVAVVLAFFAIAVAYVKGCERIVGRDDAVRITDELDAPDAASSDDEPAEVTAP